MKFTDQLLELPLFQGMSRTDINEVVAHTKLGFHKVAQGKDIVSAGSECKPLYLLFRGRLLATGAADDHSYSVSEDLAAPVVMQPECFFGLTQRYTKSFRALTECHFIRLEKAEVMRLCTLHEVFRINMLNVVSAQSQRIGRIPWRTEPQDIRSKIVRFVENRCIRPAGRKELAIKMVDLARIIGESRLQLSRELNRMAAENLIELKRGHIVIHALEKLRD